MGLCYGVQSALGVLICQIGLSPPQSERRRNRERFLRSCGSDFVQYCGVRRIQSRFTALSRAMAIEFAPDNIRVNAILPGAVDTPMLRAGLGRGHVGHGDMQERLDNLARKTVNGRVGTPEEIAHAIYFLADNEQSSFMTGQALVVDGGATARLSTE